MRKPWISFKLMPASWGLVGDAYEEAEAHYSLSGEALERRLLEIRYRAEPDVMQKKMLDLDLRYGLIDPYEHAQTIIMLTAPLHEQWERNLELDVRFGKMSAYDAAVAAVKHNQVGVERDLALLEVDHKFDKVGAYEYADKTIELTLPFEEQWERRLELDVQFGKTTPYDAEVAKVKNKFKTGIDRDIALLDVDYQFGKLNKHAYEKRKAAAKNEPWVAFIDSGFDPNQGLDGVFFELDWNKQWVELLQLHGYVGHTEEQVIEEWFADVCKSYGTATIDTMTIRMPDAAV